MGHRVLLAAGFTIGTPLVLLGWLWLTEQIERLLPQRRRRAVRAWLWLAPAIALIGTFLLWPLVNTGWLSLHGKDGRRWVGLANFDWFVHSGEVRSALENNVLWLVLLVAGCLCLGLVVAVLADTVRYEAVAKAVIVAPTAI